METLKTHLLQNELIYENINNAIIAVDSLGHIQFVNGLAEKILKTSRKDCLGKHIVEFYPMTELPRIMSDRVIEKNQHVEINGFQCMVTRIPLIEADEIIGAVAIFNDTTRLKDLNRQLEAEKGQSEILKMVLEIAYDGILVIDVDGYITMISNAYKKFLGLEEKDVIGKHVADVIENTRMHVVAKTGIPEINDLHMIKGNYMIATRIPYYQDGKIAGVVGKVIFRNVAELDEINSKISKMEQELKNYKSEFSGIHNAKYDMDHILTRNPKIQELKKYMVRIANSNSNVLILGESGTGKELFAHAIHKNSSRHSMPFVKVNCAAIPEHLLESELFGYEKGAFTGAANNGKMGKFEFAHKGTIFLDEIGDMPIQMQAKILRVLQEGEVEKIGSNKPRSIDVRIIAATNRDLLEMVKEKTFREDLYYRLNVINILIPPLRERKEDIPVIVDSFLDQLNVEYGRRVNGVSKKGLSILQAHDWSGNVRELKNVIERAYNIMEGETEIQPWHLPANLRNTMDHEVSEPLKMIMEKMEKKIIMERLIYFNGNKSKTAADLDLSRVALHKKLDKYGLK